MGTRLRTKAKRLASRQKVGGPSVQEIDIRFPRSPDAAPGFIPPMQAKLVDRLPVGDQWRYELKLDGYPAIAIKRKRRGPGRGSGRAEMTWANLPSRRSSTWDALRASGSSLSSIWFLNIS
jgi:hypothetical protein